MKVSITINGLSRRPDRAQADRVAAAARRAAGRRLLSGDQPPSPATVGGLEPVPAEPLAWAR